MGRRRKKFPWGVVAALGSIVGVVALVRRSSGPRPSIGESINEANPSYIVKYNAQALQLAAIPSQDGPAMLCSYIPFAQLESTELGAAQSSLQKLKTEYETAPEDLYGRTGRRRIVKLVKRYFDPQTFKELPSDTLYESDRKFSVPTSPDQGVPCG